MTNQPPPPPPGNPPPPPPPGNYPPPPPGNYPPPPPPGGGGFPPPGYAPTPGALGNLPKEAYTPWFTRVVAFIIDGLPIFVLIAIAYGIAFGTGENVCVGSEYGYGGSCVSSFSTLGTLAIGVAYLASFAYHLWNRGYRQGSTGQSLGKTVMKIKLVSETTGQPIGFGMAFVRDIAHIVDQIICYIGFLFPLWDAKRQTLADKMISTVVLPAQ
ncbi:RDD family protein [Mycobacterium sp. pUA109]|uniref:RDD family protein n=1 Tax=Mycobacterium sp. pUA109 TaxID=3238982 RepID=UPI00351AC4D6